ncbi:3-oxoacyl-ACP synthase III family protein [Streptomyces sp. PSAA01]|uniref:3-oxoacyl-ACP synthase III family protein n=1 Tax=Streptomyces sp. PSAA01 TaxID=2912762 RepID=UPI001F027462|nr:beta-ketoacyl-ACP synthase 3 [Streptomyces sp. PSAA01]MCG0287469.1 beta-ketoacyl-ACP synthase 3 [Streptomyces sp. PSAA01]
MRGVISGVGAALPERTVDNAHFEAIGMPADWIRQLTGITERRWLSEGEQLYDLAAEACVTALDDAGRSGRDVDLVIAATITADRPSPSLASQLAAGLGTKHVGAVDLNAACAGFVYALDYAFAAVESGRRSCVLVCAAEAVSRISDMTDRATAPLFGDAAGAVVVTGSSACDRRKCAPVIRLGSNGGLGDILYVDPTDRVIRMDGAEVYVNATDTMANGTRDVCTARGLDLADVDLFVPHQANARIIRSVVHELELPPERVVLTVGHVGNTSSSSIPLALSQARQEGRLVPGTRVAMTAVGAGVTWGSALVDWKGCAHQREASGPEAAAPPGS